MVKNWCNILSMEGVTVCGHHSECCVTFGIRYIDYIDFDRVDILKTHVGEISGCRWDLVFLLSKSEMGEIFQQITNGDTYQI